MATSPDVERLRRETPSCEGHIHLNNAGAALIPTRVMRVVRDHLELEERLGGYEAEDAAAGALAEARGSLAELVGAHPMEIAFTGSATEGFARVLSAFPFRPGERILTSRNDYSSNQIQYLSLAARTGVEILHVPDLPEGGIDPVQAEEWIHRFRPRLVALTHVPTNSGLVQDVAPIGRACRDRGIPFLLDACQSVGQIPLDVEVLGCDFLSAAARKFLRGPRGIGFLYVSERMLGAGLEPLFLDLRGADQVAPALYQPAPDARRFETWELPHALVLGMGEAARIAQEDGVDVLGARAAALAARLREGLAALPGAEVLDRGPRLCAIVTARFRGWAPEALMLRLREEGVHASALSRESATIDFEARGVEGALRLSPHAYNRESEIDAAVERIAALLEEGPPRQ